VGPNRARHRRLTKFVSGHRVYRERNEEIDEIQKVAFRLRLVESKLHAAFQTWAEQGRRRVVARIRDVYLAGRALRRRTGTAARSVTSDILPGDRGFRVGTTLGYLIAWESGIRAHQVVAKNAQVLRFRIGNDVLFRKRVFIPAQAARPSFEPALADETPYLQSSLQKLTHDAIVAGSPDIKIVLGR